MHDSPLFSIFFLSWHDIIRALILLLVANGAPVIATKLLGGRFARPVDCGFSLADGRPLFGRSKTWRGLVSSVGAAAAVSYGLGYCFVNGMLFGALTMTGDLAASFIKRRLGLVESSRARGLDTLPESLLPAVLLKAPIGLSWHDIAAVVSLFFMIEEFVSPLLYRLHIRKRPY